MDLTVLKKKISSYKTTTGKLTKVPDELVMEILNTWENWTGSSGDFYSGIDVSRNKIARIIGKGKKLKREGFGASEFKEIQVEEKAGLSSTVLLGGSVIELVWDNNKVIRFGDPDSLINFLKKVA